MATSGSTDYSVNARNIIKFAFRKLRVIASGEDPTAAQSADAVVELNLMLKAWQRYESLWRLTEGFITLVAADGDYTLSPQPHRVISARYRDANGNDVPMTLLTREEYFDLPSKTMSGIPTQYYVDYQRGSTVFYTWPVISSVTTETVRYTYQRKFEDIDSLDNDLDVRQEWEEVVGYNLAVRLAENHGRVGEIVQRIIARAEAGLEEMQDDDREDEVRFVAGWQ